MEEQLAKIAVVAGEMSRLTRAFHTWLEGYWQRPTYCLGWQAVNAVAHLAMRGDLYAQVIAAGRRGTLQLPWEASHAAGARAGRRGLHKYRVMRRDIVERGGLCSIIVP
jgi:hypothetical protein